MRFFTIILLLLSTLVSANPLSPANTEQTGGSVNGANPTVVLSADRAAKKVTLVGLISATAAGTFHQLIMMGDVADTTLAGASAVAGGEYQVPNIGKGFKITSIYCVSDTANVTFNLGHTTITFTDGTASGSPPGVPVTWSPVATYGTIRCNTSGFVYQSLPFSGVFPKNSFPFVREGNITQNTAVVVEGIVEP